MNNLVIGNTSQLSYYFADNYRKVSGRNFNFQEYENSKWDRVFICIGESKKFIENINEYYEVNFTITLEFIEFFIIRANKVIIYSTCELWNKNSGQINLSTPFNFYNTPYIESKYKITKHIIDNGSRYSNVIILFPFNFNSIYRDKNFLFGKIFNSIINKETIEIGDTYFYRDIIHPKFVVKESINCESHKIIGSGRLTFVNDFIRNLYSNYNMNYKEFVKEDKKLFKEYERFEEYYLKSEFCLYYYNDLLNDTINDINLKLIDD
jgi:nucleoside-diphosphate-sugar epimerase